MEQLRCSVYVDPLFTWILVNRGKKGSSLAGKRKSEMLNPLYYYVAVGWMQSTCTL